MAMHYCPGCMRYLPEAQKCYFCGFSFAQYQLPKTAMAIENNVGKYMIGAMIANNRQAQYYCALDQETETPVLVEEFFPYTVAGRKQNTPEVVNVANQAGFEQAKKLFLDSRAERALKLIDTLEANNTAYRIYEISSLASVAEQCAGLTEAPILFRGTGGRPLMTINGLPIPHMPPKRVYRSNPRKSKKRKYILASLGAVSIVAACVFVALSAFPKADDTGDREETQTFVVATDAATQIPVQTTTPTVTVMVTASPVPMVIAEASLSGDVLSAAGYLMPRSSYEICGKASPDTEIRITINGHALSVVSDKDGSFVVPFTPDMLLSEQQNVIILQCGEASEANQSEKRMEFLYKPTIKNIVLAQEPTEGECVLRGEVEPDASVTVFVNGEEAANTVCGADGMFELPPVLLRPNDSVELKATNAAGNTTALQDGFVIPYKEIVLNVTDSLAKNEAGFIRTHESYVLEGTASDAQQIQVYLNNAAYGAPVQSEAGMFNLQIAAADLNDHEENQLYAAYVEQPSKVSETYRFSYKSSALGLRLDDAVLRAGVRTIRGQVQAGCTVWLSSADGEIELTVPTAEDGSFAFADVGIRENQKITVQARDAADNEEILSFIVEKAGIITISNYTDWAIGGEKCAVYGTAEGGTHLFYIIRQGSGGDILMKERLTVTENRWEAVIDIASLEHNGDYMIEVYYENEPRIESRSMNFKVDNRCDISIEELVVGVEQTVITGSAPESNMVFLWSEEDELITQAAVNQNGTYHLQFASFTDEQTVRLLAADSLGNVQSSLLNIPERPRQKIEISSLPEIVGPDTLVITGQASASEKVDVVIDDSVRIETEVDAQGDWRVEVQGGVLQSSGIHRLTVSYSDQLTTDEPGLMAEAQLVADLHCAEIRNVPESIRADETTLTGTTEAFASIEAWLDGDICLATGHAEENGTFVLDDVHVLEGDVIELRAKDVHGNKAEPVLIQVKRARERYQGGLRANPLSMTNIIIREGASLMLMCDAWLEATVDMEPVLELRRNSEVIREQPLPQLDRTAFEEQTDSMEMKFGWSTETMQLFAELQEEGNYELRLSVWSQEKNAHIVVDSIVFRIKHMVVVTEAPTEMPTEMPTETPTEAPTETPTETPMGTEVVEMTEEPTAEPTDVYTAEPSAPPWVEWTDEPTVSPEPLGWTHYVAVVPDEKAMRFMTDDREIINISMWIPIAETCTMEDIDDSGSISCVYDGQNGVVRKNISHFEVNVREDASLPEGRYELISVTETEDGQVVFTVKTKKGTQEIQLDECSPWEEK